MAEEENVDPAYELDKARDLLNEVGSELHYYGDRMIFREKLSEAVQVLNALRAYHDKMMEAAKARARERRAASTTPQEPSDGTS